MKQKIDIARCLRGMEYIDVEGRPDEYKRIKLIEEAISIIQQNENPLNRLYLGIKNYASFGDQREDHEYGYGPAHGSIVFRIDRVGKREDLPLYIRFDMIYLLECVRDVGTISLDPKIYRKEKGNLTDVLARYSGIRRELDIIENTFDEMIVDSILVEVEQEKC